jgi:aminoglycoside phosphotransferase (APT) family kinase protein
MAEEPERFAEFVPALREWFDERLDAVSEPEPPRYSHWDYRWGNLLVDGGTGETRAVLDWASLSTAEPAYNPACVEYHLLLDGDDEATRERHRAAIREAYVAGREDWPFDPSVHERMALYALGKRCDARACLPLWHRERDERGKARVERVRRDTVAKFLEER